MKLLFRILVLLTIIHNLSAAPSMVDVHKTVLGTLFHNYDSTIIPVQNFNKSVEISLDIDPYYIDEMDEEKGLITLYGTLFYSWNDFRLRWRPKPSSEFEISEIRVPSKMLWLPDVMIYNGPHGFQQDYTNAVVSYDGKVVWVPPVKMTFLCRDKGYKRSSIGEDRMCIATFGSWTYHNWMLDLKSPSNQKTLSSAGHFTNQHPEWELLIEGYRVDRIVKKYNCCEEPYVTLEARFPLRRRSSAEDGWQKSMAFPCTLVTLLVLWTTIRNRSSGTSVRTAVGLLLLFLSALSVFSCALTKTSVFSSKAGVLVMSTTFIVLIYVMVTSIISNLSLSSFTCTSKLATKLLSTSVKRIFIPTAADDSSDSTKESEDERDLKKIIISFIAIIHVLVFVVLMAVFAS